MVYNIYIIYILFNTVDSVYTEPVYTGIGL